MWLPQKITPMDRLGAPGCTLCLLLPLGHDYLIRCHLPSLVAEQQALAHYGAGLGRREKKSTQGQQAQVLVPAHSLKSSIYTEMMRWFCSEAQLCFGFTKEQGVVSKVCPAPLTSLAWVVLYYWLMDSPELAALQPQCGLHETKRDG